MPLTQRQIITFVCDGPKCAERHFAKDDPKAAVASFEIDVAQIQQNPFSAPDLFFRIIEADVDRQNPNRPAFCSQQCQKDYFAYVYVVPQSPREILEQQQRENELAEKKRAAEAAKNGEAPAEGLQAVPPENLVSMPSVAVDPVGESQ